MDPYAYVNPDKLLDILYISNRSSTPHNKGLNDRKVIVREILVKSTLEIKLEKLLMQIGSRQRGMATSIFVSVLGTVYVGDKFEMLVTDFEHHI